MALNVGDRIPEHLGINQDGKEIKADEYIGKRLILYFYPKDSTPGCTAEACSFRDNFFELQQAGYALLGVSVDNEKSHQNFIKKQELPFPLIADINKVLVETFGIWTEKTLAGRKYMGTLRTTYIVDEKGVIEKIITHKEIKTKDHAEQILELNK